MKVNSFIVELKRLTWRNPDVGTAIDRYEDGMMTLDELLRIMGDAAENDRLNRMEVMECTSSET